MRLPLFANSGPIAPALATLFDRLRRGEFFATSISLDLLAWQWFATKNPEYFATSPGIGLGWRNIRPQSTGTTNQKSSPSFDFGRRKCPSSGQILRHQCRQPGEEFEFHEADAIGRQPGSSAAC